MDLSSVLAYKSCFLATRAKGTKQQLESGNKYTGMANAARCAVTLSQTAVPLFAVSECLSRTAKANTTLQKVSTSLSESNLKNIASAVTSPATEKTLSSMNKMIKTLAKLGLVANISYAAAKCMDASEDKKTETFLAAGGNCAGMYLFEHMYSHIVNPIKPDDIPENLTGIAKALKGRIKFLQKVKGSSILLGLGFVAASFAGCWLGENLGKSVAKVVCPNGDNLPNLQKTNVNS